MNWHLVWLWFWFLFGASVYIVKRGYYLIKGPNPVANNLIDFVKVSWVPSGFRLVAKSGIYWILFTPELAQSGLRWAGWEKGAWAVSILTQFAAAALFFGLGIDPIADWAIGTLVPKIPFLKDWWPQMPPPLRELPNANATGNKP